MCENMFSEAMNIKLMEYVKDNMETNIFQV